jgi:hypothetical protein
MFAGLLICLLGSPIIVVPQSSAAKTQVEVDRNTSAGDGSDANPWVSQSGCGGILEAFQNLPERGGILHMRRGRYKITKPCKLTGKNFSLQGDGQGKVIIDASTLPLSAAALTVEGALKQLTITKGDTQTGEASFAVQDPTGIAPGAWLLIRSNSELWNKVRNYYFKGEWEQVKAVSGTTVTADLKMWDSYRSGTPVSLLESITVDISGFTLIGNPDRGNGMQCFILQYAFDSSIHNTETKDCNERGWAMYYTVNSSFHHNIGVEHYPEKPQGLNYGLVVAMSYKLDAHDNNITSGRHAISIGAVGGGGVNREIKVHDNVLKGSDFMALDAHGIAEYFYYENNQITGGADFGGEHGYFRGNTVTRGAGPYLLALGELKSWDFEITNNTFLVDSPQSFGYGAIVQIQQSQDARGKFIFQNNQFHVPSNSSITTPQTLYLTVVSGDVVDMIDFSGNQFISDVPPPKTGNDSYSIKILTQGTGKIKDMRFRNNHFSGFSAVLSGMEQAYVELNTIEHAPSYGILLRSGRNVKLIKNTVSSCNKSGLQVQAGPAGEPIVVEGNILSNNGQDASQREIDRSGFSMQGPGGTTVILTNNSFYDNQQRPTQQYGAFVYATADADTVHDNRNSYSGNALKPYVSDVKTRTHWISQE